MRNQNTSSQVLGSVLGFKDSRSVSVSCTFDMQGVNTEAIRLQACLPYAELLPHYNGFSVDKNENGGIQDNCKSMAATNSTSNVAI